VGAVSAEWGEPREWWEPGRGCSGMRGVVGGSPAPSCGRNSSVAQSGFDLGYRYFEIAKGPSEEQREAARPDQTS